MVMKKKNGFFEKSNEKTMSVSVWGSGVLGKVSLSRLDLSCHVDIYTLPNVK